MFDKGGKNWGKCIGGKIGNSWQRQKCYHNIMFLRIFFIDFHTHALQIFLVFGKMSTQFFSFFSVGRGSILLVATP